MSTDYIGAVAVHGVDGTLAFSGMLVTENLMTDAQMTDNFDSGELQNGNSDTVGVAANNRRSEATFTIIPYDSSGAVATARTKIVLPGKLATITITGFGTTPNQIAPLIGKWTYIGGGSIQLSRGGFVSMTLPCKRWGESTTVPTLPTV